MGGRYAAHFLAAKIAGMTSHSHSIVPRNAASPPRELTEEERLMLRMEMAKSSTWMRAELQRRRAKHEDFPEVKCDSSLLGGEAFGDDV